MPKKGEDKESDSEIEELRQILKEKKREIEELKKRKPRSKSPETDKENVKLTTIQKEIIEKATKAHKETILQAERHYTIGSRYEHAHPRCVRTNLAEGHPTYTTLDLEWTRSGKWIATPRKREANNKKGGEIHSFSLSWCC